MTYVHMRDPSQKNHNEERKRIVLTHRFECNQSGNAPCICTTDLELRKLESQTNDCGMDVSLYRDDWFLEPKMRKYAEPTRVFLTIVRRNTRCSISGILGRL